MLAAPAPAAAVTPDAYTATATPNTTVPERMTIKRLPSLPRGARGRRVGQAPRVRCLHVVIAIVYEEQAAPIEPVPLEPINDAREGIQLLEQHGDMVHEEVLAVVKKG